MDLDFSHLTDLDIWSGLVGFVLPLLIAIVLREHWKPRTKALVTIASCMVGGSVTAWLTGYLHGVTLVRAILIVLAAAVGFYRVLWHPSGIAPDIEAATTPDAR
jgi:VIT1/CCC1 family predicted Fe2+/Mn2+ transporter